jgi:LysW-gamma-L-lysine/LysW-L-ornithine aminotransferase
LQSGLYGNRGLTVGGGEGSFIFDSEGRRYIDFFCGHGSSLFGHAHPVLVNALKRAAEVPWSTGAGLIEKVRVEASEALMKFLPGFRVYWGNSGTEAIEAALKICALNRPGRARFLALRRSFHGRTAGALSLTFNPRYREPFSNLLFSAEHFRAEDLPGAIDERTSAVFIEPVQGEGGVHLLSRGTGKAITDRCRETGALLVADEIQTGFGRCGSFLASPDLGIEPDVVCLSKGVAGGLPAGVTLWREELSDFLPNTQGSTAGGNPLVCAVALAALDLLEKERYPARAMEKGAYFRELIEEIDSPQIVEVRGIGLLTGIEVKVKAPVLVRKLQERGVLALAAGPLVVRFLPPFVAEKEQFLSTVRVFRKVLEDL